MSTPLQFVSLYDDQEVLPAVLHAVFMLHLHRHLSLNRRDPLFLFVLPCPLGLLELQACPLPDVVFPPLPVCLVCFPISLRLARKLPMFKP